LPAGLDTATGRVRPGSVLGAGTSADMVRLWYPGLGEAEAAAMVALIDARCHAHGRRGSVVVDGVAGVLGELAARGFALGVATNDATAAATAAMAALGFAAWLPHIYGYDSVPRPKPAADSVLAFAAAVGVPAAAVAVVGDNRHDLEMARAAGAGAAIGVLTGNSGFDDLAPLADVVLPSIRDLPGWLADQNRK
jgi:phosphoglycolate phosphatase